MNPFIPYIGILRPSKALMASLAVLVGALVAGSISYVGMLYAMTATFLIFGAGVVINDYFDYDIDKINAPSRALPSNRIPKLSALRFTIVLFLLGLTLSLWISPQSFILASSNSLLLLCYSWKLKRVALIGNIVVGWLTATTFLFGALLVPHPIQLNEPVWILALLSFFITTGREVFGDIADIVGDRQLGAKTYPIVASANRAQRVARLFLIIGVILSPLPYLLVGFNSYYLVMASFADAAFIFSLFQDAHSAQKTIQLGMILALLAFLLGK